eukprot:TRINITY_DN108007_c0_g1_i1.p1 TRINITY_DN108007_c0_g1~~TRINITY_DN108007_c0_g1_i1.p1  ORF type:complete len:454 (-),score=126.19 TRINITY_DN108007_c0_g1_i1:40-1401(-)
MGSGASASVGTAVQAASAAEIAETISKLDDATREKLHAAVTSLPTCTSESQSLEDEKNGLQAQLASLKQELIEANDEYFACTGMLRAQVVPCMRMRPLLMMPPLEALQQNPDNDPEIEKENLEIEERNAAASKQNDEFAKQQEIEDLREEIQSTQKGIEEIKSELSKAITNVQLRIGGEPHKFSGWDNGGSTGYTWSCDIADEQVVKVLETQGKGRDTTAGRCGGGRDFEYEFHGISPGQSIVKISHGRAWDPASADVTCFKIHVAEADEEELQTKLAKARAKHAELAETLKEKRSDDTYNSGTITGTSPGLELFEIRRASYNLEVKLDRVAGEDEENAIMAELEREEKELDAEEQKLTLRKRELQSQLGSLQDELQELTGIGVLRKAVLEQSRRLYEEGSGMSAAEWKRIQLEERQQQLETLRNQIGELERDIETFSKQVAKAKAEKTTEGG